MKTYYKEYKTIDIKGVLDTDAEGNYFIHYEDGDNPCVVALSEILDKITGEYVRVVTIPE